MLTVEIQYPLLPRFFKILSENDFIETWHVNDQPDNNFALQIVRTSPHHLLSGVLNYLLDNQGLICLANFCAGSVEPVAIAYDSLFRFFIISEVFLSTDFSGMFELYTARSQTQHFSSPISSYSFPEHSESDSFQNQIFVFTQPLSTQIESIMADILVPVKSKNLQVFGYHSEDGILTPPQTDFAPFLFY